MEINDNPIAQAQQGWRKRIQRANDVLLDCGIDASIDEIALLFLSYDHVLNFITKAVQEDDVKLFNFSHDHVHTTPIKSDYGVSYWFLETPYGYRVEMMCIDHGHSPLHDPLRREAWEEGAHFGGPVAVHLSFKTPTLEAYEVARGALVGQGLFLVQACESDYGKFAYYGGLKDNLYLKPRVNTRDAELYGAPPITEKQMREMPLDELEKLRRPIKDTPQA